MPRLLRIAVLLSVTLLLLPIGSGRAQENAAVNNRANLRIVQESVFIPAERAADAGRWPEAVRALQKMLENDQLRDSVVSVDSNTYEGIHLRVRRLLRQLPEQGIQAYQDMYDARARTLLHDGIALGEPRFLDELIRLYPVSSHTEEALRVRARLHLERDEPQAAEATARQLIQEYGDVRDFALMGLALSRRFKPDDIRILIATLPPEKADLPLPGTPSTLETYLRKLLGEIPAALREEFDPGVSSDWNQFGGNPSHTATQGPDMKLTRNFWSQSIRMHGFARFRTNTNVRNPINTSDLRHFFPTNPTVHEGILYVNSDNELQALNLYGERPDPLWPAFRSRAPEGEIVHDDRISYSNTVHNGVVYAPLVTRIGEGERRLYLDVTLPFPRFALNAVDAYSGRLLWRTGGQREEPADDREFVDANISYPCAPTFIGDELYAIGVYQTYMTDPFKHYLVQLDPDTGEILDKTFIASGMLEMNLFNNSIRDSYPSAIASDGDLLFCLTNLGACAAIERNTGLVRWVLQYDQIEVHPVRGIYPSREASTWYNNPPIVSDGIVYFTPMDSHWLYAVELSSGNVLWKVNRGLLRNFNLRYVAGIHGNKLIAAGTSLVAFDLDKEGAIAWTVPISMISGYGRPALTRDTLYFATSAGVVKIDPDSGKQKGMDPFPPGTEPGSLLIIDDSLVVSTFKDVQVFHDPGTSLARWRERADESPDNPNFRFKLGLKLLQAHKPNEAIEAFEETLSLLGPDPRPELARLAGAAHQRLYAVYMELGEVSAIHGKIEPAIAHFQSAASSARDEATRAQADLALAGVYADAGRPKEALALFRGLMQDVPDIPFRNRPFYQWATEGIQALLVDHGRSIYASLDAEAAFALKNAKGSETRLEDVLYRYPNSLAAPAALHAWAALRVEKGNPDGAARLLRQILRDYPDYHRGTEVLVALVDVLESRELYSAARTILQKMLAADETETVEQDGRDVPLRNFAAARLEAEIYRKLASDTEVVSLLPPLKKGWQGVAGEPGARVFVLPDRPVLLGESASMAAFSPETGDELWKVAMPGATSEVLAYDTLFVAALDRQIIALHTETGERKWSFEFETPIRRFDIMSNMLIIIRPKPVGVDSMIEAYDPTQGTLLWRSGIDGAPVGSVQHMDDKLAVLTHFGGNSVAATINLDTGKRDRQIQLATRFRPTQVYAGPTRMGLLDDQNTLRMINLETMEVVWTRAFERTTNVVQMVGGGGDVVIVAQHHPRTPNEKYELLLINGSDGNNKASTDALKINQLRHILLDAEAAYLLTRDEKQELGLTAYRRSDLTPLWSKTIDFENDNEPFIPPPILLEEHVMVPLATYNTDLRAGRQQGWNPTVHFFPRDGSVENEQEFTEVVDSQLLPRFYPGSGLLLIQTGPQYFVWQDKDLAPAADK
jgi:outer membrane protein assembly factor BamB/predicted negative regulator of RcsB-dependent stress response